MLKMVLVSMIFFSSINVFAWGKRGHEITSYVAASVLAEKFHTNYLKNHAFDLGYYANVPDIIWRNIKTDNAKNEGALHFIDWNKDFEKIFGTPADLPEEFADYRQKVGGQFDILKMGVSPYRIHQMHERCKKIADSLEPKTQGPLLVCLGTLSHYIEDLGMPLHMSDNYDGQMTNQKGIHVFFETVLVDALEPELRGKVLRQALIKFSDLQNEKPTVSQAIRSLMTSSYGQIDKMLKIDRKLDRKNIPKAAQEFQPMIVERMSHASAVVAYVWKDIISNVKSFDDEKFYFFEGAPEYVAPDFL